MIKYRLICDAGHEFDGWFASSSGFDAQRDDGLLACPDCGSHSVNRAVMAPAVPKKANSASPQKLRRMMQKLTDHVEQNFDYVGDGFAEEARKIHYGETAEREIYGETTPQEAHDLLQEGVPVAPLPGVSRQNKN